MNLIDFAILAFGSLFVIVDPIGLIPTFLVMTRENPVHDRIRMAGLASRLADKFFLNAFQRDAKTHPAT